MFPLYHLTAAERPNPVHNFETLWTLRHSYDAINVQLKE